MTFKQPVNKLIEKRYSCRSYTPEPIERSKTEEVESFLQSELKGPFNSDSRFELITATDRERSSMKNLGTYGLIKNPAGFIIGTVSPSGHYLEDFGYLMEKIILKATDLDLGTCWLGGTFNRSSFAERINLQEKEVIPAVTATGNIAPRRTIRDGISRRVAKSDHRRSWQNIFFDGKPGNPLEKNTAGEYTEILELMRLAPSASNKQPWRIIKDKNTFHFFLQRDEKYTRQLNRFKTEDLQRVDMGIALCHFELAAKEAHLKGKLILENPGIEFSEAEYIASWKGE